MINVHAHSDYSNMHSSLDSTNTLDLILKTSLDMGLTGTALTDHNILTGHFDFLKKVQKINKTGRELLEKDPDSFKAKQMADFIGILGNEIYITREGLGAENYQSGDEFSHFILLAKDKIGWQQLNELSTVAWDRMFKRGATRTPNYLSDLERIIGENPGHLIATTACLGSYLGSRIIPFFFAEGEKKEKLKIEIIDFIVTMKKLFGSDFYFEVQPGLSDEQRIYNQGLAFFGKHFQVPLIAATDAHYSRPEWRKIHSAYLKSQDAERETDKFYEYTYIMSQKEMQEFLAASLSEKEVQEAILNSYLIKNKITSYTLELPPIIPSVPFEDMDKWEDVIHRYDEYEYFHKFSHSGSENKFFLYRVIKGIEDYLERGWLKHSQMPKNLARLNEEFEHILGVSDRLEQHMSTYFTTMQKIIDISWKASVISPGRGSAGAYLTNFILGITQDNPLDQPAVLPIYRFIHKDKVALPDIDFDTASAQRERVFELTKEEFDNYGIEVTNIMTIGTEKSKSALLTAARGLGLEPEEGLYFSSMIPSDRGFPRSLKECYYGSDDKQPIKEFVEAMDEFPEVWEVAQQIEGLINRRGVHASGVVFFDKDKIYEQTALMRSPSGQVTTQFNLNTLEEVGCVKIDFLSTEGADGIQTSLLLLAEHGYIEWKGDLRETYNAYVHPKVINYTDKEMWKQIHRKEVLSLFQFGDSPVGEQAIEEVKPENLLELATINAVMRLMAPEGQEMPIIQYRRRKNNINIWYEEMKNFGLIETEIKILEFHLLGTLGLCVTQEQLMELVQDERISNFDFLMADKTRKIIAKKKMSEIESLKKIFFDSCEKNNTRLQFAQYIWDNLFAIQLGYSFNGAVA